MIRAVMDTSVLIRYLIKPGAAIRALIEELWVDERFVMVTSPEVIMELEEVLERPRIRRRVQAEDGAALLDAIRARADMIPELDAIPEYTRDCKDDKFVAYAIAGQVDYLVTTDEDILVLGELLQVRMVTPYQFVQDIGGVAPDTIAANTE